MVAVPFPSILILDAESTDAEEFLCALPAPARISFLWLASFTWYNVHQDHSCYGRRVAFLRLASVLPCALRFLKMVVLLENIVANHGSECDLLRIEAASLSFPAQKEGMPSLEIHSGKRRFRRQTWLNNLLSICEVRKMCFCMCQALLICLWFF